MIFIITRNYCVALHYICFCYLYSGSLCIVKYWGSEYFSSTEPQVTDQKTMCMTVTSLGREASRGFGEPVFSLCLLAFLFSLLTKAWYSHYTVIISFVFFFLSTLNFDHATCFLFMSPQCSKIAFLTLVKW